MTNLLTKVRPTQEKDEETLYYMFKEQSVITSINLQCSHLPCFCPLSSPWPLLALFLPQIIFSNLLVMMVVVVPVAVMQIRAVWDIAVTLRVMPFISHSIMFCNDTTVPMHFPH